VPGRGEQFGAVQGGRRGGGLAGQEKKSRMQRGTAVPPALPRSKASK